MDTMIMIYKDIGLGILLLLLGILLIMRIYLLDYQHYRSRIINTLVLLELLFGIVGSYSLYIKMYSYAMFNLICGLGSTVIAIYLIYRT